MTQRTSGTEPPKNLKLFSQTGSFCVMSFSAEEQTHWASGCIFPDAEIGPLSNSFD